MDCDANEHTYSIEGREEAKFGLYHISDVV